MGVDPEQARRVAASMFDAKGNYAPRSSGAWQEGDTMDATLSRLSQRGAGAATVGRRVTHDIRINDEQFPPVTTADEQSSDNLESVIARLARDKRRAM